MSFAIEVPGRVNLIGEHIDYLGFPVLPMAIRRRLTLRWSPRDDRVIRVVSEAHGAREFEWTEEIAPSPQGDFANYVKAAAQTVGQRWGVGFGIDCEIASTIPEAAGLSSSSALVIAAALALLQARGDAWDFAELMEVLPEGERYVGTRGGGMDHAVCLAAREGCALKIGFSPLAVEPVPVPCDWAFFVAHSLRRSEKSGAQREEYNRRRALAEAGDPLALRHALAERERVEDAALALRGACFDQFGELLNASHRSLRDDLKVSCEAADHLVESCLAAGAAGARIMGGGFGGYVVGLCRARNIEETIARLDRDHYSALPERAAFPDYLMRAEPGDGALTLNDQ
ncbi:MAG TPA: galactokinase family protein [Bryobacteraceae bacterium]|nr:galactokinase family protein [Bryobacteraceae bacterium]